MAYKRTSFSRLQQQFNRHEFRELEKKHFPANSGRKLTHWGHFSFWMYALLTRARSLRFAVDQLNAMPEKLYHMGLKSVKLSTLSEANTKRTFEFYRSLYFVILHRLKKSVPRKLKKVIRVLDATTVTFLDDRFKWAKFRTKKHGVKVHVLYDEANDLPRNLKITNAKSADVKVAHRFSFLKGIIYVFDRAYTDFKLWRKIHQNQAFFVIRAKSNLIFTTLKTHNITNIPGVLERRVVALLGDARSTFPEHLYLFRLIDLETHKEIEVLTNNPDLTAEEISEIYRNRWSIELFFKWLKQNLQIKRMYGFSENAVRLQIWLSMILYLLLWQMYHITCRSSTQFKDFLRRLTARLMLPADIPEQIPLPGAPPNPQTQREFAFSTEH